MEYRITETKARIEEIDIVKALAMLSVVLLHASFPLANVTRLYCVAVFFVASGFVFKSTSSDSILSMGKFLLKRIKGLWLPFVFWTSFFILLNNFFLNINIYTNNKAIYKYATDYPMELNHYMSLKEMLVNILKTTFFGSGTTITGACWFLVILFKISLMYCVIDFIIKKISKKQCLIVQTIVSAVLLMAGYLCCIYHLFHNGNTMALSYYCLFHLGVLIKRINPNYYNINKLYYLFIMFISLVVLAIVSRFKGFGLSHHSYFNPFCLVLVTIAGWCFLFSVSFFIKKTRVKNILALIGRRTISILVFHLLAFKIIELIVVKIYGLPDYCLAVFPNLYGNKRLWWVAYTIVGVFIPLLLNEIYRKINEFIRRGKHNE